MRSRASSASLRRQAYSRQLSIPDALTRLQTRSSALRTLVATRCSSLPSPTNSCHPKYASTSTRRSTRINALRPLVSSAFLSACAPLLHVRHVTQAVYCSRLCSLAAFVFSRLLRLTRSIQPAQAVPMDRRSTCMMTLTALLCRRFSYRHNTTDSCHLSKATADVARVARLATRDRKAMNRNEACTRSSQVARLLQS